MAQGRHLSEAEVARVVEMAIGGLCYQEISDLKIIRKGYRNQSKSFLKDSADFEDRNGKETCKRTTQNKRLSKRHANRGHTWASSVPSNLKCSDERKINKNTGCQGKFGSAQTIMTKSKVCKMKFMKKTYSNRELVKDSKSTEKLEQNQQRILGKNGGVEGNDITIETATTSDQHDNYQKKETLQSKALRFKCKECGIVLKTARQYKRHSFKHLPEETRKKYLCGKCEKRFTTRTLLRHHKCIHKKFHCKICEKIFSTKASLQVHHYLHTGELPYKCQECSKGFRSSRTLLSHQNTHKTERHFMCELCGKCFKSNSRLKEHQSCHRSLSFPCKICNKVLKTRTGLDAHHVSFHLTAENLSSYSGQVPSCKECGKLFYSSYKLARHQRVHTGKKPFSCQFCGKTFSYRCNMKKHEKFHTCDGVRVIVHECSLCGKAFDRICMLRQHRCTTHSDLYFVPNSKSTGQKHYNNEQFVKENVDQTQQCNISLNEKQVLPVKKPVLNKSLLRFLVQKVGGDKQANRVATNQILQVSNPFFKKNLCETQVCRVSSDLKLDLPVEKPSLENSNITIKENLLENQELLVSANLDLPAEKSLPGNYELPCEDQQRGNLSAKFTGVTQEPMQIIPALQDHLYTPFVSGSGN